MLQNDNLKELQKREQLIQLRIARGELRIKPQPLQKPTQSEDANVPSAPTQD